MSIKTVNEYRHQDIALIATYEDMMHIPQDQRVTYYFGDYGGHFFKYGVTDEQAHHAYEKALSAIEMTPNEFTRRHGDFVYRGEIIGGMWDCLLAKSLQAGERVWFVPTQPDADGAFRLHTGTVESVDAEKKTCSIRMDTSAMDDVPLHYVLGRWNEDISQKHYGHRNLEPFYFENPSMCDHYLYEVSERWKQETGQMHKPESAPDPAQSM